MDAVLGETVALFHRLKEVSQQVHGQGDLSSGQWGVLRDLNQTGSQTVPQMARSRPVSRQYIQSIVDALIAQGLVEPVENPAHRRSSLIHLTTKGKSALEEMNRRAGMVFRRLSVRIPEADLQRTAATLQAIRGLFVGEEWDHILTELKS